MFIEERGDVRIIEIYISPLSTLRTYLFIYPGIQSVENIVYSYLVYISYICVICDV